MRSLNGTQDVSTGNSRDSKLNMTTYFDTSFYVDYMYGNQFALLENLDVGYLLYTVLAGARA